MSIPIGIDGGGETCFVAIKCSIYIGGVCSYIVGEVGGKTCEASDKTTRTAAVGSVIIFNGWIVVCTPAESAGGHGYISSIGHIATASGRSGGDIGGIVCNHCRVILRQVFIFEAANRKHLAFFVTGTIN